MWHQAGNTNTSLQGLSFYKGSLIINKTMVGLTSLNTLNTSGSLHSYWHKCRSKVEREQRKSFDGIMIYFWRNIWKERNRRIFQQKTLPSKQVMSMCKDGIQQYKLATSQNAMVSFIIFCRCVWRHLLASLG